jgi:hypothetical protein
MTQGNKKPPTGEKRNNPRIDTLNKVNYILFNLKMKKIGHGKGLAVNLSQNGVLLQTKDKLDGAFIILMAVDLDRNEIKIKGKIITSRVCEKTNSYLTGIEFIDSKAKQLSAIILFVKDFHRRKHMPIKND